MSAKGLPEPPAGWVYVDAVTLIKCVDDAGKVRYRELMTESLTQVEALGMATTFIDTLRKNIMEGMR